MRYVTYRRNGTVRHGAVRDDRVTELGEGDLLEALAEGRLGGDGGGDAGGDGGGRAGEVGTDVGPVGHLEVLAPILRPPKVLAVAANYQEHVNEAGGPQLDKSRMVPRFFLKPQSAVTGPGPVPAPKVTRQMDWEGELVVVIGTGGKDIPVEQALDHVGAYATGNDFSGRSMDYGFERDPGTPGASAEWFFDWLAGKWLDGFAAYGPYLVTADEIGDPQDLHLQLWVNGEQKQDGTTADMIFTVAEQVSWASRLMTLEPGDLIFTGTPSGVGATTGQFLSTGDLVEVELEGLGRLSNRVG